MELSVVESFGAGMGGVVSAGMVFIAGWRIALKRNGYVKKTEFVKLDGKVTFMQFLMMETTTPGQQEQARQKMKAFEAG